MNRSKEGRSTCFVWDWEGLMEAMVLDMAAQIQVEIGKLSTALGGNSKDIYLFRNED